MSYDIDIVEAPLTRGARGSVFHMATTLERNTYDRNRLSGMSEQRSFEILADTILNRFGLVAREFKRIV